MPKHKKQPSSARIIRKAGTSSQGEAVIPPIPESEQPDPIELQVMSQVSQLKNAFYQISGQQTSMFETIVGDLMNKWSVMYKELRILRQQNKKLTAELKSKPSNK